VNIETVLSEIGEIVRKSIRPPVVLTLSAAGKRAGKHANDMSQAAQAKSPKLTVLKCADTGRVVGVVVDEKWDEWLKKINHKKGAK